MVAMWNRYWADESGQGLVEYVLIIALVAIGLTAIMIIFRDAIGGLFSQLGSDLDNAPTTTYP